ncbi:MAG TPA: hypothetical protein PLL06_14995 [Acidobacteriota bacterium]|nr:hypothetical protein [Acidobacteriota bacterium]HMZ81007.1 hypothetical protein [Acidobacteriota bacterium]HNG95426.1 hypothetical protein [Acidobacteriota bacterium]
MGSEKLLVKKEFLPTRCEICHQADQFDPVRNICQRCQSLAVARNPQPVALAELQSMATPRPVRIQNSIEQSAIHISQGLAFVVLGLLVLFAKSSPLLIFVALSGVWFVRNMWKTLTHRLLTAHGDARRGHITEFRNRTHNTFEIHFVSDEPDQEPITGVCEVTEPEWYNARQGQPVTILHSKKYPFLKPILYEFSRYQVAVPKQEE